MGDLFPSFPLLTSYSTSSLVHHISRWAGICGSFRLTHRNPPSLCESLFTQIVYGSVVYDPSCPSVGRSIGRSVSRLAGRSVITSPKGRKVTLPCSYRGTCFKRGILVSISMIVVVDNYNKAYIYQRRCSHLLLVYVG